MTVVAIACWGLDVTLSRPEYAREFLRGYYTPSRLVGKYLTKSKEQGK